MTCICFLPVLCAKKFKQYEKRNYHNLRGDPRACLIFDDVGSRLSQLTVKRSKMTNMELVTKSIQGRIERQKNNISDLRDMLARFESESVRREIDGEIYATKREIEYLTHLLELTK